MGCSPGTCPKAFAKQFNALVGDDGGPIGLLATHLELGRAGAEYGGDAGWINDAVAYLDEVPSRHGGAKVSHERLWLVVQGYDVPAESVAAARRLAESTGAGALFVALSRLDQSYKPRIVAVK